MSEEELKKILTLLETAGWQPQLCDTPIPIYESVHAGNPVEPGQIPPDMVLVPKAFLRACPESMVKVSGNSMVDVGIEDGDVVRMTIGAMPHDGDIVVVAFDGDCTVKSYYVDDDGSRWLVPQNNAEKEKYKVIRLDEHTDNVYLCGVVTELMKPLPRVQGRKMRRLVNEAKAQIAEVSQQQVEQAIAEVAPMVKNGRQWYAVFRAMVDQKKMGKMDYEGFCTLIKWVVSNHNHLPNAEQMQRLAVQSFAKPVTQWDENDAPVTNKPFYDYQRIAEKMLDLLTPMH